MLEYFLCKTESHDKDVCFFKISGPSKATMYHCRRDPADQSASSAATEHS